MFNIVGIDFTSSPSKRKKIVCCFCNLTNGFLKINTLKSYDNFNLYESDFLKKGSWISGFDFPFGLPNLMVSNLGFKKEWKNYVQQISNITKEEFKNRINILRSKRKYGEKFIYRTTDKLTKAGSPMQLINPPLAQMFYEGSSRLLLNNISVYPCNLISAKRIAFETYPKLTIKKILNKSYKNDSGIKKRDQFENREKVIKAISSNIFKIEIKINKKIKKKSVEDTSGDTLDSVICACTTANFIQNYKTIGSKISQRIKNEGWIIGI